MLSIGKLAVGQADYYLEQALGSVTRAGAVASGVEDYYLSGPEAPGEWVGDGTRALGLGGPSMRCGSTGCWAGARRQVVSRSGGLCHDGCPGST